LFWTLELILLYRFLRITKERTGLKFAVIFSILSHGVIVMLTLVSCYLQAVLSKFPSTALNVTLGIFCAFPVIIVQQFLIYRLYRLSATDNWKRAIPCFILAIASFLMFVAAIVVVVCSFYLPGYANNFAKKKRGFKAVLASGLTIDLLTTLSLVHYLIKIRLEGGSSSQRLVRKLTILTVETGLMPTINATVFLFVEIFAPTLGLGIVLQMLGITAQCLTLLITLLSTHRIMQQSGSSTVTATTDPNAISRQLHFTSRNMFTTEIILDSSLQDTNQSGLSQVEDQDEKEKPTREVSFASSLPR
jgi:hypothetical protein